MVTLFSKKTFSTAEGTYLNKNDIKDGICSAKLTIEMRDNSNKTDTTYNLGRLFIISNSNTYDTYMSPQHE